jgi:hypothetical protein
MRQCVCVTALSNDVTKYLLKHEFDRQHRWSRVSPFQVGKLRGHFAVANAGLNDTANMANGPLCDGKIYKGRRSAIQSTWER